MLHILHFIFSLDDKTIMNLALFCAGLAIFALLFFIFLILNIANSKPEWRKNKPHFDERQINAQNQAYRWTFYTLISYFASCYIVSMMASMFEIEWFPVSSIILTGIAISLIVFIAICVFKDAYFAITQKRKSIIICTAIIAVSYAMNFIIRIVFPPNNNDFQMTYHYFIYAVSSLSIFVIFVIKAIADKRAGEDE